MWCRRSGNGGHPSSSYEPTSTPPCTCVDMARQPIRPFCGSDGDHFSSTAATPMFHLEYDIILSDNFEKDITLAVGNILMRSNCGA